MCIPQNLQNEPKVPCIMYLHSHGGTAADALPMRHYFLPKMAVCKFDFAGCGLSEGEYITLGPRETRDTLLVIKYIRENFRVDKLFLWGRSMGAVAAIMLASEHPEEVVALVLDSPFSDLTKMVVSYRT
jgi:pimeloyl-ACP methyl ester carboxylesterase